MEDRVRQTLWAGLLRGYLELEISEMKDSNIAAAFESARRIVDTNPISIFERQLQSFEQVTAIISSVAALSSFTRRKAWPILFLTSIFSFAEKLGLLSKLTFNLLGKSNKHHGKDSLTTLLMQTGNHWI